MVKKIGFFSFVALFIVESWWRRSTLTSWLTSANNGYFSMKITFWKKFNEGTFYTMINNSRKYKILGPKFVYFVIFLEHEDQHILLQSYLT